MHLQTDLTILPTVQQAPQELRNQNYKLSDTSLPTLVPVKQSQPFILVAIKFLAWKPTNLPWLNKLDTKTNESTAT